MERTRIELEFIFRASPVMLYRFLTAPANIVRWFCDEVDIDGTTFTFYWDGSEEEAELVEDIEDELVKFQFEDYEDEEFLTFEMKKSPLTGETILTVSDYCDDDEVSDQRQLWENQIKILRQEIGG